MSATTWVSLDLDDVLVDFLTPFLAHLNAVGGTCFVEADVVSPDWAECTDREGRRGDRDQALAALEEMVWSEDLFALELRPQVLPALRRLKHKGVSIVVNTHRHYHAFSGVLNRRFAAATYQWAAAKLGTVVDAIEIVDGPAAKLEVCARYAACVHCDDRISNLEPIAKDGCSHAVVLTAPWNAAYDAPALGPKRKRIERARSMARMFEIIGQTIGERPEPSRPSLAV